MFDKQVSPSRIMQLATGYWDSAALLAANELQLFDAIGQYAVSAEDMTIKLIADLRGLSMILDACVGLGLLIKGDDGRYSNSPEALAFLVKGSPAYLGDALRWSADQYPLWGKLANSVQAGTPAKEPSVHLGDDPDQTRTFVMAMHNRAKGIARVVTAFIDLSESKKLLDIGGGPGTYSVLLAQKYPELEVTLLELPAVAAIAIELISASGLQDRVATINGSAVEDQFGVSEYDSILISGVLHQMAPSTIQNIFVKARLALKPGGKIFISDVMLNSDKTQPVFSTLFSLQMLLTSNAGAVFSVDECKEWLEMAGFGNIQSQKLPEPLPYVLVVANS